MWMWMIAAGVWMIAAGVCTGGAKPSFSFSLSCYGSSKQAQGFTKAQGSQQEWERIQLPCMWVHYSRGA